MISQAEEIELLYNGECVLFDCPGRRISVPTVENYFGLRKVLFDKTFYPTDNAGFTLKIGLDVKRLTVSGDPTGTCVLLPAVADWPISM